MISRSFDVQLRRKHKRFSQWLCRIFHQHTSVLASWLVLSFCISSFWESQNLEPATSKCSLISFQPPSTTLLVFSVGHGSVKATPHVRRLENVMHETAKPTFSRNDLEPSTISSFSVTCSFAVPSWVSASIKAGAIQRHVNWLTVGRHWYKFWIGQPPLQEVR